MCHLPELDFSLTDIPIFPSGLALTMHFSNSFWRKKRYNAISIVFQGKMSKTTHADVQWGALLGYNAMGSSPTRLACKLDISTCMQKLGRRCKLVQGAFDASS
jgi:hypothetical protein